MVSRLILSDEGDPGGIATSPRPQGHEIYRASHLVRTSLIVAMTLVVTWSK
jgi:hypothetical protein